MKCMNEFRRYRKITNGDYWFRHMSDCLSACNNSAATG